MIEIAPSTAMTMNHSTITGPNTRPIFSVPRLCTKNSPTRMMSVSGRTNGAKALPSTLRPSIADSTDTAGVNMPSP